MPDGGRTVPALLPRLLRDLRLMILEVNVPYPVCKLANPLYRVAATELPVSGIKAQAQNRRVGHFEQVLCFRRSLDPRADMVVEHSTQTSLVHHALRNVVRASGKYAPSIVIH